ncbi:MAG: ferritin family protein [Chloroflexi bacterium]|nr:ferritin family protein [Chloroflexota bacterium]
MATDQQKTLEALRIAVQMEIDGKEFYLRSSQNTSNKMGEKLLRSLSKAEDVHRQKFIQIYESIRDKNAWPKTTLRASAGKGLKTVFATATKRMASSTKPQAGEIDAVQTAMKMENKTFDFYKERESKAAGETERSFFRTIAAEEREHHLALLNYYEFLADPTGWFIKSEHHSIDGG